MSDSVCPKCGFEHVTPTGCPSCGVSFTRSMPFEASRTPAVSHVFSREVRLDRELVPGRAQQRADSRTVPAASTEAREGTPHQMLGRPISETPAWAQNTGPLKKMADASEPAWFLSPPRPVEPMPAEPTLDTPRSPRAAPQAPAVPLTAPATFRGIDSPKPEPLQPPVLSGVQLSTDIEALDRRVTPMFGQPAVTVTQRTQQAPSSPPPRPRPASSPPQNPAAMVQMARMPVAPAPNPMPTNPPATPVSNLASHPAPRPMMSAMAPAPVPAPMPQTGALPSRPISTRPPEISVIPSSIPQALALELRQSPFSPDAAPQKKIQTHTTLPVEEIHATPAGLFSRGTARIIDLICLGCLMALVLLLTELVTGESFLRLERMKIFAVPLLGFFCALTFVYTALFHTLGGRTPGKWVTGIYLLDETGQPPSFTRSALRALAVFISAAPLFLGFVVALFSRRRQSFHDKLTGTYVVRLIDPHGSRKSSVQ